MSIGRKATFVGAVLLYLPATTAAQQLTTYQITVPFSISKLHPDIRGVKAVCRLGTVSPDGRIASELYSPGEEARLGPTRSSNEDHYDNPQMGWPSGEVGLSGIAVSASGEYSGSLLVHVVTTVPANMSGTPGGYECGLQGCAVAAGPPTPWPEGCNYFRTSAAVDADPRFVITLLSKASTASGTSQASANTRRYGTRPVVKGALIL